MIFNIGTRLQAISAQANLLQQVKSRRDGRSQNRRLMKGLPI